MRSLNLLTGEGVRIVIALLLLSTAIRSYGQTPTYSYFYRVYFKDKGDNLNYSAEDLLSSRAISRRQKAGIPVPDFRDFPVNKNYLNIISSAGYKLHCTSKWMNTALFKTQFSANISTVLILPFVRDVKIVKSPGKKAAFNDKLDFQITQADPNAYDRPVTMLNGKSIHNSGYDGKGVLIAILDGGFTNADQISSLISLRSRSGVKKTYDFIKNNESVYNSSSHGTAVLSVLAGNKPGFIEGTATGADYLLLKTEDVDSEFPVEEDFWAAGAEYADSTGADIISSSLGYYNFDDPSMNYKYSDLDGNTAFVTRVADIAASKGILVVNSAGNERNKEWKRIIFPSDGDSVLAVGAVDGNNNISSFSSAGPSIDGRIKPDNATMGVNVPVQVDITTFARSSGTSFSCPVLSGMAACLMQSVPGALNTDIIEVLQRSADRYNSPDSLYGYGIPDMVTALAKLQDKYVRIPLEESIIGPNPTTGNIEIIFREPPERLTIEIVSMMGKVVYKNDYRDYAGRTILITELQKSEQGMYFIRIIKGTVVNVHKIIKLRN
jgi:serine protease AprX